MRTQYWPLLLLFALLTPLTSQAQTYLATRDHRQILIGDRLFTMQDNVDYRVVGVAPGGGPYILTPLGVANCGFSGRCRVLSGGTFADSPTVTLKDAESVTGLDPGATGDFGKQYPGGHVGNTTGHDPFWKTTFEGDFISPENLTHVYVAYQWYVEGKPVATATQFIGAVKANEPVHLFFLIPIEVSQKTGTYSIHIYSGYNELKQTEVKKGATW